MTSRAPRAPRDTTPQLERIGAHCERLRLHRVGVELSTLLEQAAKHEFGHADFLDEVLGPEIRSKQEKHLAMRVSTARFPFRKTLERSDGKFQPSIDPKVIKELATGRFLAASENVLLLGPPGRPVALQRKVAHLALPRPCGDRHLHLE